MQILKRLFVHRYSSIVHRIDRHTQTNFASLLAIWFQRSKLCNYSLIHESRIIKKCILEVRKITASMSLCSLLSNSINSGMTKILERMEKGGCIVVACKLGQEYFTPVFILGPHEMIT